jgi:hypothetical protein
MVSASLLLLALFGAASFPSIHAEQLLLTVGYCPTEFTGGGAVVEVDTATGKWDVLGKFKWPSAIIGCPALEDPIVTLDRSTGELFLYFLDDELVVGLDTKTATVKRSFSPSDMFFTGFENMQASTGSELVGLSGTVTEKGFCFDGCYQVCGSLVVLFATLRLCSLARIDRCADLRPRFLFFSSASWIGRAARTKKGPIFPSRRSWTIRTFTIRRATPIGCRRRTTSGMRPNAVPPSTLTSVCSR